MVSRFTLSPPSKAKHTLLGVYYLILSAKTGYNTNPNKVYWSTSLSGPWTGPADIAPEHENTYGSQNSDELVIKGSSKTTYIYLGDAWDTNGTAAANYMWLPMIVDSLWVHHFLFPTYANIELILFQNQITQRHTPV
jgi:hypothetical protein